MAVLLTHGCARTVGSTGGGGVSERSISAQLVDAAADVAADFLAGVALGRSGGDSSEQTEVCQPRTDRQCTYTRT
jgi:hypothetical protein